MREALLPATAALALFLVTGTVISELASPFLSPTQAHVDEQDPRPRASGLAQAVLDHITMARPIVADGDPFTTDPADCAMLRTIKTTLRPLMLLNATSGPCPVIEMMTLRLEVDAGEQLRTAYARVLLCEVGTYTIASSHAGDRRSGLDDVTCQDLPYFTKPGPAMTPTRIVVEAMVTQATFHVPGLKLVCMGALADTADARLDVQDLTWFEVWDAKKPTPNRAPHIQSEVPDTPCERLVPGIEMWGEFAP